MQSKVRLQRVTFSMFGMMLHTAHHQLSSAGAIAAVIPAVLEGDVASSFGGLCVIVLVEGLLAVTESSNLVFQACPSHPSSV
jgi:hypothetical protein